MTRRSHALLLLSSAALCAAGCGRSLQGPCEGDACPSQRSITHVLQTSTNRQLDILFILDDTSTIAAQRTDLLAAYPDLARALENFPDGIPSLHVGFASASPCDAAPTTRGPNCGIAAPAQFLTTQTCGRETNFTGAFESTFSCLADLGATSCGPAQPLAALRRVLESPPPGWQGFLRPEAYLQIVLVTGADDASGTPVAEAVDFVRGLKPDAASQIAVSIIGPPDCASAEPAGNIAPRLLAFVQSFGANGLAAGLCSGGLRVAFSFRAPEDLLAPACLKGAKDVDAETPGPQLDCTVEDTVVRVDGSKETTVLPSCEDAPPPCWRANLGAPIWCDSAPTFTIDRGPDFCVEWSTHTRVECLGCVDPNDPACAAR